MPDVAIHKGDYALLLSRGRYTALVGDGGVSVRGHIVEITKATKAGDVVQGRDVLTGSIVRRGDHGQMIWMRVSGPKWSVPSWAGATPDLMAQKLQDIIDEGQLAGYPWYARDLAEAIRRAMQSGGVNPVSGTDSVTPTKYVGLSFVHFIGYTVGLREPRARGYGMRDVHRKESNWRFVDDESGQVIGPIYKTRARLLADLDEYATSYGFTELRA